MRQLAAAGWILLACLLGFASSAHARNRYTGADTDAPVTSGIHYFNGHRAVSVPYFRHGGYFQHTRWRFAGARYRVRGPLSITPAHAPMADLVLAAARRHGVPAALAYGVASVESGFNPGARSRSGAVGLMQIMPNTARGLGCRGSLSNPAVNADCGARYLAAILGDHGGNIRIAAAMYNQGRFARHISRGGARYAELVMQRARRLPA